MLLMKDEKEESILCTWTVYFFNRRARATIFCASNKWKTFFVAYMYIQAEIIGSMTCSVRLQTQTLREKRHGWGDLIFSVFIWVEQRPRPFFLVFVGIIAPIVVCISVRE